MRFRLRALALGVFTCALLADSTRVAVQAPQLVSLTPTASPTAGQAAIHQISVTGSNFPSGTISPGAVTLTLRPATAGAGPTATCVATSVTTVIGTTRRVSFLLPSNLIVSAPTSYAVTISGQTTTGVPFQSQNSSALTINPPATISDVTPASAFPAATITVTLNTQFTNFVQGSTQASFGPDVTVGGGGAGGFGPVTVLSPTQAVAHVAVTAGASLGWRAVQIRTGAQTATSLNAFNVVGPILNELQPNAGQQGRAALPISVSGQNTHWIQGSSTMSFGPGISVTAFTVTSPTTGIATITIDPSAVVGPRTVTVTTGAEVASVVEGFIVKANTAPTITSTPITTTKLSAAPPSQQLADLTTWSSYQYPSNPSDGPANWVVQPSGTTVIQSAPNPDASLFVSNFSLECGRVEGTIKVSTANDDDSIGFVFGYQDPMHLYRFQWKKAAQAPEPQGMRVYAIAATSPEQASGFDDGPFVKRLFSNSVPWVSFVEYRYTLEFTPGQFKISVYQGLAILESVTIIDATYSAGKFGFFNHSQASVEHTATIPTALCNGGYRYQVNATDSDGDVLTYSLAAAPTGMVMGAANGLIAWSPTFADVGSHAVTLKLTDSAGSVTTQSYALAVLPPNRAPVIVSVPPTQANVGARYVYQASATDADIDDGLVFSLVEAPAGMQIDAASGLIAWTPTLSQLGTARVRLRVTDQGGLNPTQIFEVTVGAAAPVVSAGPDQTATLPGRSLPIAYTFRSLPGLSGAQAVVQEINDIGEVVGSSNDASGLQRPTLWRSGSPQALPTPGGAAGNALAISINGQVVAQGQNAQGEWRDYIYGGDGIVDFARAFESSCCTWVMGMNRFGDAVGLSDFKPIIFHDRTATLLPLPAGMTSGHALKINDGGVIAGIVSNGSAHPPARWVNGEVQILPTLGGPSAGAATPWAYDVNNYGEIVGYVGEPAVGTLRAVVWHDGQLVALDRFGGPTNHVAWSINDYHEVLLQSGTTSAPRTFVALDHAFVELTPFIPSAGSNVIAQSINNRGQVAGWIQSTPATAFVLDPIIGSKQATVDLKGDVTPAGSNVVLSWEAVNAPGPVTFSNPHSVTTKTSFTSPGVYVLRLSATDAVSSSYDDVTITVSPSPAVNEAPTVDAGQDRSNTLGSPLALNGAVSDDGLPTGGAVTSTWWKLSGPGTVVFSNREAVATSAVFSSPGTYILRLVGSDGVLSDADDVVITVDGPASALSSVEPNAGSQGAALSVTVVGQNTHWVQGSSTASFGAGISVSSFTVTSPTAGTATINVDPAAGLGGRTVTVTTGMEVVSRQSGFSVTIRNTPPLVSAGPDQSITFPAVANLLGTVTDDGLPSSGSVTVAWLKVSGLGTVLFSSPTSPVTTASFSASGTYTLRLLATDGSLSTSSDVTVNVDPCLTAKEPGVRSAAIGDVIQLSDGRLRAYAGTGRGADESNPIKLVAFVSSDGVNWTPEAVQFEVTGDEQAISALRIIRLTNGSYRMYFEGDYDQHLGETAWRLYSAVSTDGLSWVQEPGIRIDVGGPNACVNLGTPEIVELPGGSLRLYYSCSKFLSGAGTFIVSATSTDGLAWVADAGVRLAPIAPATALDVSDVARLPDGRYRMYYTAVLAGQLNTNQVFSATSSDLLNWTTEPGARIALGPSGSVDNRSAAYLRFVPLPDSTYRAYYFGDSATLSARWCSIDANNPPSVNAGADQTIPLTVGSVTLAATATDDGLPGGPVAYQWRVVSGPGSVAFSNSSAATTTAQFSAPGGYVLAVVVGDGQLFTLDEVSVTVTSGTEPGIVSVLPSGATQGGGASITVTGQNTHFTQGTSSITFGPGITINSVTVSNSTALTAQVSVAQDATTGQRMVTVTTGGETARWSGFSINASSPPSGAPALAVVNPNSAQQGQSGPLTIVGSNTQFVQGVSQLNMGAGITVNSVTVTCPTCLTAQVSITDVAPTGSRPVVVTTGSEIASLLNGFTVLPGTPILTSLNPATGRQGQTVSVVIGGRFTHFAQGPTQVSAGADISVTNVVVTDATHLNAQLAISVTAALGLRPVTVTTGSEIVSTPSVFSVIPPAALTSIDIVPAGEVTLTKGQNVQFSARGTFSDGSVQDPLGGVTWASDKPAVASLSGTGLAAGLAAGVAKITASKTGVQSNAVGFVVKPLAIGLFGPIDAGSTGVDGALAEPGATVQVFVNGLARPPTTIATASGEWVVSGLSPALVVGDVVTARQTVNGVQSDSSGTVTVTPGLPKLISITPQTGTQGQQNLVVTIAGQNTHFVQASSQVSFAGTAITVNSVTVTSSTSLTANISIALNAQVAPRTLTVATGSEVAALPNAFSVTAATNTAPTITIAPSWTVILPNRLTLNYTVTDDGLPIGGALTMTWAVVNGPGTVGFQDQTPTAVSVGFDQAGSYQLRLTASDTVFTKPADITVTVSGGSHALPTVSITSPTDGAEITAPIDVVGTVASAALASWRLEYRGSEDTVFRVFATGTNAVDNGVIGRFDPTLLLNGVGAIRLTAFDTFGAAAISDPVTVVLTKNFKVGHFTIAFKDLEVPLSGIGIQLIRSYDSRNVKSGDFGVGWTLDIRNVRVRDNGPVGLSWYGTKSGGAFPNYCVQGTRAHVVTVTLSDGTVYRFEPQLDTGIGFLGPAVPNCQPLVPILSATLRFAQVSGPPATLTHVGSPNVVIQSAWPGPVELLDESTQSPVDFDRYLLTLPDGKQITVSRTAGLEKLAELNGNFVTVTPAGIVHSSGKSIAFVRDAQHRITLATDPSGNVLKYEYDAAGDLVAFTDQVGNRSAYTYDANHRLLTIKDPRGIEPIRNEYDAAGRLIRHVDALGHPINYVHDLANRLETVTDRLGHSTVNEVDADGNIIRVTDALGGITDRTYDGQGNVLTETDPLGRSRIYTYDANNNRLTETDPLGKKTTYTYNARNQVLTITDALGRLTTNVYDGKGNLTSTIDALQHPTTHTYDGRGQRTSTTDRLGGTTTFEYDASGNLIKQTDALGHVTSYTYDANGNRLTETKSQTTASGVRTVLTQFEYDGHNRLTKTTFADGGTTQTVYNQIGRVANSIDQLNRQTVYEYDEMGRLRKTTFPGNASESSTYDEEGRRLTSTDRGGHVTSYAYDDLGRLTKTTFADDTATRTEYDLAGQVTKTIDARGNPTSFGYDNAGRRTAVTDALGHVTSFSYDALGNQLSMADANGHTTSYEYDSDNRRVKTIYADDTFDSAGYDQVGRTTSKIDQAGKITQFEYDLLGRLTAVVDALGQRTTYGYDELANRTSQADANSHTTSFGYDALGRRTSRTLPLGMSESYTYNAAGSVTAKIDFNGKTTTYAYDAANRLTRKTPDPSFNAAPVQFAYSPTGQRTQMVDASGTTSYAYDIRDRLVTKATPQGTLAYTWNPVGGLTTIQSSNAGGTSVSYDYDELNRLTTVTDHRFSAVPTTYTYDDVGNLKSFLYANGVKHTYQLNTVNRLTGLVVNAPTSALASYDYVLGPAGNQTSVTELGGRKVEYAYDALYRLTSETISGAVLVGAIGYQYDNVGNRLQRTSTVSQVSPAVLTFDANDRIVGEAYDANGNTIGSPGSSYVYDFEDRLTSGNNGGVTIVYDGDGNRVAKTVGGATIRYLVDDRNPTNYAQVLEEVVGGAVQRRYTYGVQRISESLSSGDSFYGYDGHGSVRLLVSQTGTVSDRYDYDAFGNGMSQDGNTPNVYLHSGEQFDADLGTYYLRARYMAAFTGRFWTADSYEGDLKRPGSLQLYSYGENDPVNNIDPSGHSVAVVVRPLDVGALGFLSKPVFNHVFLAFDSPVIRSTFSFHPKEVCDGYAPNGLFHRVQNGVNVVLLQNVPCIKRDDQIDMNAVDRHGNGVGYGWYPVNANPAQEAALLDAVMRSEANINRGEFSMRRYSLGITNCASWVEDMLYQVGLAMPSHINVGVGTEIRFGLNPGIGISLTHKFDSLLDFVPFVHFGR